MNPTKPPLADGAPVCCAVYTSSVGNEFTLAVIALSVLPIIIEARKALDPSEDEFEAIPW